MKINENPAKYLANTICVSVRGLVNSSSIVPVRFSSAKDLMVIAGMMNMKIKGALKKRELSVEIRISKTFSDPLKTHMNRPIANKKMTIVM